MVNYQEEAAKITAAADQIVAEIQSRLAEKPDNDKPLFVVLGEDHFVAAHQVLHMLVLKKLADLNPALSLAVSLELQHNTLSKVFNHSAPGAEITEPLNDPGGVNSLRAQIATVRTFGADLSHKMSQCFLLKSGIPVHFNDTAVKFEDKISLDITDDPTQQAVKTIPHDDPDDEIEALSETGFYIRNYFMVKNAQRHADRTDADIHIQICGESHVAGYVFNHPYSKSQTSLLNQDGCHVLAIPVSSELYDLENEAIGSGLLLPGICLEGEKFNYSAAERTPRDATRNEERTWLNGIAPYIDLDPKVFKDTLEIELDSINRLRELFEQAIKESQKTAQTTPRLTGGGEDHPAGPVI